MDQEGFLKIYVNDHLAIATGVSELAERCHGNNRSGELDSFLTSLQTALRQERSTLKDILSRLGGIEDPAKQAAAWFLEKVGRLKLNGRLLGYSDLSRLEELEALALGLQGKQAFWETLGEVGANDPRLAGLDFDRLREQARRQYTEADLHRRQAARRTFSLETAQAG